MSCLEIYDSEKTSVGGPKGIKLWIWGDAGSWIDSVVNLAHLISYYHFNLPAWSSLWEESDKHANMSHVTIVMVKNENN